IIDEFRKDQGIDLSKDKMALQRLKESAEKAKIELSSTMESEINLPFITADQAGPKHLVMKLTRAKFEQLVEDILQRTIEPCRAALNDAGVKSSQIDEVVLVGGSTRIPKVQQMVKEFFGKEPNKSVNPDEVVAIGAAIQAGVLGGEVKDILLLDVTPLTLAIETLGSVATPMIARNTTVPASKTETFSTAADNQTQVEIHVVQGERPMASDNKSLGKFVLDGIPPAPRGVPQVEVTFDIDASGILKVSAKDKATNKEQSIRIEASSGLSADESEKMKKDAEVHAADDEQKKSELEINNLADTSIYTAEKAMRDFGDKLDATLKSSIEKQIDAVRKAKDTKDTNKVKAAVEELQRSIQQIGANMYEQPNAAGGAPGGNNAGGPGYSQAGSNDGG